MKRLFRLLAALLVTMTLASLLPLAPVAAATPVEFTKSITGGANDGFSGPWGFYSGLTWYEVGNPGQPYHAWYRFTGITIPKGATILQAYLSVVETRWDSGVRLKISADKAASPTAPTSTSNHNSKTRTTASVAWSSGFADWAYHNSPDISAVIQELVNANAYSNGAIQLLVDNSGSNGEAVGRTVESGQAPRLYVRYQEGTPANSPPVLAPIGDKTGTVGVPLSFTVSATDPDTGDTLAYSAANLPAGASFDPVTHTFSWPSPAEGTYPGVVFGVDDGHGGTDSETITIAINPAPANRPPVLDPIGNKTGTVGILLSFTIAATDPDAGDTLTYSAAPLPSRATFNASTHVFRWTPATSQVGTYSITFTVRDNHGATDAETITITVNPVMYTLTVNVVGQGTVEKNPDQAAYAAGTSVTLTARPAAGYYFSAWSGSASGSTNPLTITMNGNKTVTATFLESGGDWWNAGWTRRRDVTIRENSGETLVSYQVRLAVAYSSAMQADFDDVRFIDNDNATQLPYWRESLSSGSSAVFWVKVPSLPASGSRHIWMYYGNGGAASASNIHTTFIWGDDFNDSAWTAGNIQQVNYDACSQYIEGGVYHQEGVTASEPIAEIYQGGSLKSFPADYVAEVSFQPLTSQGGAFICPRYLSVADKYECVADIEYDAACLNKVVANQWYSLSWVSAPGMDAGGWYKLSAVVTREGSTNRFRVLIDDNAYVDMTDSSLDYPGLAFLTYDWDHPFHVAYDNFRVRAYAPAEPTATFSGEMQLSAGHTIVVPVLPTTETERALPPLVPKNLPPRKAPPAVSPGRNHLDDGGRRTGR